jgi:hypothetical protein
LEVCAFSRAHLHEHCHLTKNGSVVDGQDDKDDEDGENLDISPGTHLVTAKREHGSVQADHVLIAHTHLVLVVESQSLARTTVEEVKRRHPHLVNTDDQEPRARNDIHNEEEHHEQLKDFDLLKTN